MHTVISKDGWMDGWMDGLGVSVPVRLASTLLRFRI